MFPWLLAGGTFVKNLIYLTFLLAWAFYAAPSVAQTKLGYGETRQHFIAGDIDALHERFRQHQAAFERRDIVSPSYMRPFTTFWVASPERQETIDRWIERYPNDTAAYTARGAHHDHMAWLYMADGPAEESAPHRIQFERHTAAAAAAYLLALEREPANLFAARQLLTLDQRIVGDDARLVAVRSLQLHADNFMKLDRQLFHAARQNDVEAARRACRLWVLRIRGISQEECAAFAVSHLGVRGRAAQLHDVFIRDEDGFFLDEVITYNFRMRPTETAGTLEDAVRFARAHDLRIPTSNLMNLTTGGVVDSEVQPAEVLQERLELDPGHPFLTPRYALTIRLTNRPEEAANVMTAFLNGRTLDMVNSNRHIWDALRFVDLRTQTLPLVERAIRDTANTPAGWLEAVETLIDPREPASLRPDGRPYASYACRKRNVLRLAHNACIEGQDVTGFCTAKHVETMGAQLNELSAREDLDCSAAPGLDPMAFALPEATVAPVKPTVEEAVSDAAMEGLTLSSARALLREGDVDALQAAFAAHEAAFDAGEINPDDFTRPFNAFHVFHPPFRGTLEAWGEAYPESASAQAALGAAYERRALIELDHRKLEQLPADRALAHLDWLRRGAGHYDAATTLSPRQIFAAERILGMDPRVLPQGLAERASASMAASGSPLYALRIEVRRLTERNAKETDKVLALCEAALPRVAGLTLEECLAFGLQSRTRSRLERAQFLEVLEADAENHFPRARFELLLSVGRTEEAAAWIEEADLFLDPFNAIAQVADPALEAKMQDDLVHDPSNPFLLASLAWQLAAEGQADEAMETIARAHEHASHLTSTWRWEWRILEHLSRADAYLPFIERAIADPTLDPTAWFDSLHVLRMTPDEMLTGPDGKPHSNGQCRLREIYEEIPAACQRLPRAHQYCMPMILEEWERAAAERTDADCGRWLRAPSPTRRGSN